MSHPLTPAQRRWVLACAATPGGGLPDAPRATLPAPRTPLTCPRLAPAAPAAPPRPEFEAALRAPLSEAATAALVDSIAGRRRPGGRPLPRPRWAEETPPGAAFGLDWQHALAREVGR